MVSHFFADFNYDINDIDEKSEKGTHHYFQKRVGTSYLLAFKTSIIVGIL